MRHLLLLHGSLPQQLLLVDVRLLLLAAGLRVRLRVLPILLLVLLPLLPVLLLLLLAAGAWLPQPLLHLPRLHARLLLLLRRNRRRLLTKLLLAIPRAVLLLLVGELLGVLQVHRRVVPFHAFEERTKGIPVIKHEVTHAQERQLLQTACRAAQQRQQQRVHTGGGTAAEKVRVRFAIGFHDLHLGTRKRGGGGPN